jgi:TrmH family RNA methyltransferase
MKLIASSSNAQYKDYLSLLTSKGIKKSGRCLVSGWRFIDDILERSKILPREILLLDRNDEVAQKLDASPRFKSIPRVALTRELFDALDEFGIREPIAIYDLPDVETVHADELKGRIVALPLQNPENVGAAIRSATAFGMDKILILQECAQPFLPKAIRASAGAVFSAKLIAGPSINDMTECRIPLLALDSEGQDIRKAKIPDEFVLLSGLEGPGIPKRVKDSATLLSIPISNNVESLNASVALGVALFQANTR